MATVTKQFFGVSILFLCSLNALCTSIHAAINQRAAWFIHFFIKSCFQSYWPLTASLYSILEGSTTKP